jgi:hypothetical protein
MIWIYDELRDLEEWLDRTCRMVIGVKELLLAFLETIRDALRDALRETWPE